MRVINEESDLNDETDSYGNNQEQNSNGYDAEETIQVSFEETLPKISTKPTEVDANQIRHKSTEWKYLQTFASLAEFDEFRKEQKNWSCDGISKSNNAIRRYFRCNLVKRKGPQCAHRLTCVEDESNTDFVVYVSTADHTHSQISNRMNREIRERIIKLNENNADFTAQKIRDVFVADQLPYIPKLSQIQSIIRYHCQTKTSSDIITIGDVVAWAEQNTSYDEIDINTPFVVDFKASNHDDDEKHFQ